MTTLNFIAFLKTLDRTEMLAAKNAKYGAMCNVNGQEIRCRFSRGGCALWKLNGKPATRQRLIADVAAAQPVERCAKFDMCQVKEQAPIDGTTCHDFGCSSGQYRAAKAAVDATYDRDYHPNGKA